MCIHVSPVYRLNGLQFQLETKTHTYTVRWTNLECLSRTRSTQNTHAKMTPTRECAKWKLVVRKAATRNVDRRARTHAHAHEPRVTRARTTTTNGRVPFVTIRDATERTDEVQLSPHAKSEHTQAAKLFIKLSWCRAGLRAHAVWAHPKRGHKYARKPDTSIETCTLMCAINEGGSNDTMEHRIKSS